ncbi:MAG: flagellar filament capping protein FliD [Aromatoleum sp.]|jgi:flagellar hook-associated protein 2|uniref:flagellar filament capping protein FliD n=1 Tax=Aromatoleum sp. TaxID=2307007 RepID=UPI00289599F0|nr:flagellar filament capping protein FliD [Aromatoleum sp.]MDT3668877.1 flagellar filament capping protein FliD [Aromatoleum sp.]
MAISAPGVGSGLDIKSIISQLMAAEREPLNRLQTQQTSFQARLSAYGQIKSALSKLQDAATALTTSSTFSATTAKVSDAAAFMATSSASAVPGIYAVQVDTLARTQRVATSATTTPSVSPGSLTITFGSYDGSGNFTSDGASPKTVTLTAGSTLAELSDAINAAKTGVTARVINNGTTDQLVLTGDQTGAAKAFQVSGTGGLTGFSFDAGNPGGSSLTSIQAAKDARLTIDGIAVTRSTNTVTDVIEGVALALTKEASSTELTVARNDDVADKAINDFATAYNELNKLLRDQSAFNAETKKAGTLNGDSVVRSIQNQLRSVFQKPLSDLTGAKALSDIGLSFKTDGSLSIDKTKLTAALADPTTNVAELFAGNGTVKGYAKLLGDTVTDMLDADGLVDSRTDGINRSIKALDARRDAIEFRLERIEARYVAQFTALDSMMASMNQTSSFLTQQLANLPTIGQ